MLLGDTTAYVDAYLVVLPVGNVLQQVLDVIGFLSPCNVFVLLVVKGRLYALALKDADAERGVFGRCASKEYLLPGLKAMDAPCLRSRGL